MGPRHSSEQSPDTMQLATGAALLCLLVLQASAAATILTTQPDNVLFTPSVRCNVWTYNEDDDLMWVSYQAYKNVVPNQTIRLTASGSRYIKLWITPQGALFTADKNRGYI